MIIKNINFETYLKDYPDKNGYFNKYGGNNFTHSRIYALCDNNFHSLSNKLYVFVLSE